VGGQSDWRQYLTLPNILKQFNPNVTGYSTGEGSYQVSVQLRLNQLFATTKIIHFARMKLEPTYLTDSPK
jgi:hypothetical protein